MQTKAFGVAKDKSLRKFKRVKIITICPCIAKCIADPTSLKSGKAMALSAIPRAVARLSAGGGGKEGAIENIFLILK